MRSSSSFVSEQKPDLLQQLGGRSVEESCIIVDRDELHCEFPDRKENDRHKPYKVPCPFSSFLCFMFSFIITNKAKNNNAL